MDNYNAGNRSPFNRRNFLKSGPVLGSAMAMPSAFGNVPAAKSKTYFMNNNDTVVKSRTLGSGNYSFTVSALALAWLVYLLSGNGFVPNRGTIKLAHLNENMASADIAITAGEWKTLENTISKIKIVGDRYPADQQKQVGR